MVKEMSHLANPIYLHADKTNVLYYKLGKDLLALFYLSHTVLPK